MTRGSLRARAAWLRSACLRHLEWVALGVVLAVALALRVHGLNAGLPGGGLSPDENTVVPKAIGLLERGTLDPGWFLYPSLYLMVLAGALAVVDLFADGPTGIPFASETAFNVDPSAHLLTGRVISALAGVALVLATWALGRRAFGWVVGTVASLGIALAPVAVAYSHVAVTDMSMAATLTAGVWLIVAGMQDRSRRRLLLAGAVIGLATSFKYNAGFGVLPLIAASLVVARQSGRSWRRSLTAPLAPVGLALAAFVAGTPYSVLSFPTFARDFVRQNRIVADGWLGFETAGPGWWFNLHPVLTGAIGGGLLVLGAIGLVTAAVRRRPVDLVLGGFALGYFAYISTWNAHFDRYLLPIVPVLVVLGAGAARAAVEWARGRERIPLAGAVAAAVLVALAVPAWRSAELVASYGKPDRRLEALPVIQRLVPIGSWLAVDPLGPPLLDYEDGVRLAEAGHQLPYYRLLEFETPLPGARFDRRRDLDRLRRWGIRYVVTSDDIRRRVLAAASLYRREARFYRRLAREGRVVRRFPSSLGPGVTLWDISPEPPRRLGAVRRTG